MLAERIAIIGAGPAGLAAASGYRAGGGRGVVTLIGDERHMPYERPPLSKEFLRGELDAGELSIEPERWYRENAIDVRLGARALAIEPATGIVELDEGPPVEADAIVLATGSEPLREPIEGGEHPGVTTLRTIADSERLRGLPPGAQPTVVVGTGFIGCEVAASLSLRGEQVVLIGDDERPQQARLGAHAGERIAGWLRALGVELLSGERVAAIRHAGSVELTDGSTREASRVVLGLGARPRVELAETAGLELRDGAVVVDSAMRCSGSWRASVLAVGDIALAHNGAAGRHLRVEHWGDALGHGEIAGRTLAGQERRWEDVPGFWSSIGARTLKYAAWGDGHDACHVREGDGEGFTVWYGREGTAVGVLTHERDEDYARGRELIRAGAPLP